MRLKCLPFFLFSTLGVYTVYVHPFIMISVLLSNKKTTSRMNNKASFLDFCFVTGFTIHSIRYYIKYEIYKRFKQIAYCICSWIELMAEGLKSCFPAPFTKQFVHIADFELVLFGFSSNRQSNYGEYIN